MDNKQLCDWNPAKHKGKLCPKHQGGGSKTPEWDAPKSEHKEQKYESQENKKIGVVKGGSSNSKKVKGVDVNKIINILKNALKKLGIANINGIVKVAIDDENIFAYFKDNKRIVIDIDTHVGHLEIKPPFTDDSKAVVIWRKNAKPNWDED